MTIATNYQANAKPVSWVTGLEYAPADDSKCARCKTAPATCWVSFEKAINKARTKSTVDLLDCRREIRRVRLALAGEDTPKEGEAEAARDKLLKQLEFLQREEREIVNKTRMSGDSFTLDSEIEILQQVPRKVALQAFVQEAEQNAPPRVELLEPATVRNRK